MLDIFNRDSLPSNVIESLEHIVSSFRSLFLVEHNEDGTHREPDAVTNLVPTGGMIDFAGSTAPAHWLLCNGAAVNRVQYRALFEAIGTTYGAGDGVTTFNIPDCRQRFSLGKAASGTGSTLGSTGGTINHTHTLSGSTAAGGGHDHSTTAVSGTLSVDNNLDGFVVSMAHDTHTHTISTESDHTHGVGTLTAGTGNPPYIVFNRIIKT